jgi:MFS family permease
MTATAPSLAQSTAPAVWRNRYFRRLWTGQVVSNLGDQCYRVAVLWYLANATHGIRNVALLAIAMAVPTAVFGMFAGAIADRFDRWRVMLLTDIGRAALAVVIAVTLPLANSTGAVYLGSAFLVLLGLAFNPAVQASLPRVVGEERVQLIAADSWLIGSLMASSSLGPALAGLLYVFHANTLVLLDAATFLVSAATLWSLRARLRTHDAPAPGGVATVALLKRVRLGSAYLRKEPVLRPQFATFPFMESLLYAVAFLLPIYVTRLGYGSGAFGLLMGVWMAGRIVGLVVFKRSRLSEHRGLVFGANFIVQGCGIALASASHSLALSAVGLLLAGLPSGGAQVAMSSYVQTSVPDDQRALVFATLSSRVMWLMPLGPLALGLLADHVGIRTTFGLSAVGLVLGGVFIASRRAVVAVR